MAITWPLSIEEIMAADTLDLLVEYADIIYSTYNNGFIPYSTFRVLLDAFEKRWAELEAPSPSWMWLWVVGGGLAYLVLRGRT